MIYYILDYITVNLRLYFSDLLLEEYKSKSEYCIFFQYKDNSLGIASFAIIHFIYIA